MKKLLIFMLVLGLAPISQAAMVNFTVGGSSEYYGTAGETITIDLIADSNCYGFGIGAVAETDGTRSQVNMGGYIAGDIGDAEALTAGPDTTLTAAGYVNNYNGLLFDIAAGYGDIEPGVVIASFTYTIASIWDGSDYWINALAMDTEYEWMEGEFETATFSYGALDVEGSTVNTEIGGLHIIPEPATIVLLGLGGLLLRRRKK